MATTSDYLQLEPPPICGRRRRQFVAPTPTFVDRRPVAPDNLSARRRWHCCCVLIVLQFSMTKNGHQKILRVERNFFGNLGKSFLRQRRSAAAADFWDRRR